MQKLHCKLQTINDINISFLLCMLAYHIVQPEHRELSTCYRLLLLLCRIHLMVINCLPSCFSLRYAQLPVRATTRVDHMEWKSGDAGKCTCGVQQTNSRCREVAAADRHAQHQSLARSLAARNSIRDTTVVSGSRQQWSCTQLLQTRRQHPS